MFISSLIISVLAHYTVICQNLLSKNMTQKKKKSTAKKQFLNILAKIYYKVKTEQ